MPAIRRSDTGIAMLGNHVLVGDDFLMAVATAELGLKYSKGIVALLLIAISIQFLCML